MIRELGEEGFKRYRKNLLNRGRLLHSYVEARLLGDEDKVSWE